MRGSGCGVGTTVQTRGTSERLALQAGAAASARSLACDFNLLSQGVQGRARRKDAVRKRGALLLSGRGARCRDAGRRKR